MLLSDRRRTLIFLCMAGMEAAWITPFALLLFRAAPHLAAAYGLVLLGLLGWILALELISRTEMASPRYEVATFGLMILAGLLLVRLLLYFRWPAFSFGWLGQAVRDVSHGPGGFPPALALILINLFLWHRATTATGREISFFNVGMSFRRGLLLLIFGAGLYGYLRGRSLLPLLWAFLAFGLAAVALARIDEKSRSAQSVGTPLPLRRLAQLSAAIGVTLGVIVLLARFYTQEGLLAGVRLFAPVGRLLRPVLEVLFVLLVRILDPFFRWLDGLFEALMAGREVAPLGPAGPSAPPEGQQLPAQDLPYWLSDLLPRALLVLVAVIALVAFVALLMMWVERVQRSHAKAQIEEEGTDAWRPDAGFLGRGLASLRAVVGQAGRFGVGRHLLAAISVENLYANLCRLARRRGYGRRPAQPPDDYLPVLVEAFGGHEEALARLTTAYMRVHYGDRPIAPAELAALRADYLGVLEPETD